MDDLKFLYSKSFLLLLAATLLLVWVCYDGLVGMVSWWERDEYSHGYLIPFVAIYLVWQKRSDLKESIRPGSIFGLVVLLGALFLWMLGEVSSIYTIIQYAFWVGIWGLAIVWVGISGIRTIWAGLFYLFFMIPLPNFIYFNLSQELQLISSALGVAVIRWFDISVFLEGNVIDLGVYQLQVVEACSGLRYLFPLMSFGFLIAYIYRGPFWQRVVIFLSTIPITVLMNSFRVGVIGVTVEHFGIAAAEGFLHDFEGWIVFMACLGVLVVEIWLFYLFSRRERPFSSLFDLDFGAGRGAGDVVNKSTHGTLPKTGWLALVVLAISVPASQFITERRDDVPSRTAFNVFPLEQQEWTGRESTIEANVLGALKLTDYFMGNFQLADSPYPVNFYSAWYEEQRKGASIHSPKSCLPGGGWEILQHTTEAIPQIDAYGEPLKVNRVLMQMGEARQLVYYWFQGRGRIITNEYMAKWFIFWDSLTRNRTDGALMRLITYVPEGSDVADAENRLNEYLEDYYPMFSTYVPD